MEYEQQRKLPHHSSGHIGSHIQLHVSHWKGHDRLWPLFDWKKKRLKKCWQWITSFFLQCSSVTSSTAADSFALTFSISSSSFINVWNMHQFSSVNKFFRQSQRGGSKTQFLAVHAKHNLWITCYYSTTDQQRWLINSWLQFDFSQKMKIGGTKLGK